MKLILLLLLVEEIIGWTYVVTTIVNDIKNPPKIIGGKK